MDGAEGAVLRGRLPNRGLGSPTELTLSDCRLSRLSPFRFFVLDSFLELCSVWLLLIAEPDLAPAWVGGGGACRLALEGLDLVDKRGLPLGVVVMGPKDLVGEESMWFRVAFSSMTLFLCSVKLLQK